MLSTTTYFYHRFQITLLKNFMGIEEIILIALVLLVLFGAKRIPEMMKGIGKGISQFNEEKNARDDKRNEED